MSGTQGRSFEPNIRDLPEELVDDIKESMRIDTSLELTRFTETPSLVSFEGSIIVSSEALFDEKVRSLVREERPNPADLGRLDDPSFSYEVESDSELPSVVIGYTTWVVANLWEPATWEDLDEGGHDLMFVRDEIYEADGHDVRDDIELSSGVVAIMRTTTIDQRWRGVGLGLTSMELKLEAVRILADAAFAKPRSILSRGLEASDRSAIALSRYWGKLGFVPVREGSEVHIKSLL